MVGDGDAERSLMCGEVLGVLRDHERPAAHMGVVGALLDRVHVLGPEAVDDQRQDHVHRRGQRAVVGLRAAVAARASASAACMTAVVRAGSSRQSGHTQARPAPSLRSAAR